MARPILYRCPSTGYQIQAFLACEPALPIPADKADRYRAVECLACGRQHLLNIASNRLLAQEGKVYAESRPQAEGFEGC